MQALRNIIPGMKAPLAQPINVNDLGKVAVKAALGEVTVGNPERVMNINEIIEAK